MMAVVDTNVLIYDTFEDSIYHDEAKNLLDSLDRWMVLSIVVHEYVWVMKTLGVSVEDTAYKVEEYLNHPKTRYVCESAEDLLNAFEVIRREKLSLSRYNDKVILSVAIRIGSLASFDDKLRRQALRENVQVLPDKF